MRMKISLPLVHALAMISKLSSPNPKNKRHESLYWFGPPLWCNTLLQCSVVDCLVGWDEQVQGKNYLLRRGVLELDELECVWNGSDPRSVGAKSVAFYGGG